MKYWSKIHKIIESTMEDDPPPSVFSVLEHLKSCFAVCLIFINTMRTYVPAFSRIGM